MRPKSCSRKRRESGEYRLSSYARAAKLAACRGWDADRSAAIGRVRNRQDARRHRRCQPFPSLGSRDKPAQEADGSTVLYLGPMAPDGKQGNWLRTVPGRGYFAILRLYGPTEAAIDKSWKPGDI